MPRYVAVLQEMGRNIEQVAGREVSQAVMEGSEALKDTTSPAKVARWVQGAMERLDALVDQETRGRIMARCGHNCAAHNQRAIDQRRAKRRKHPSLDAFLAAEEKDPSPGTRLERQGDVLYVYYTPRSYTRPMRCYCSLLRGLPEEETVSPTFCECSRGFVEKTWESIVERPVRVELVESCVSGAAECKFAVYL